MSPLAGASTSAWDRKSDVGSAQFSCREAADYRLRCMRGGRLRCHGRWVEEMLDRVFGAYGMRVRDRSGEDRRWLGAPRFEVEGSELLERETGVGTRHVRYCLS
jgi:hypothetical protein